MSESEKKTSGSNPIEAETSHGHKTVAEALADGPKKARLAAEAEAKSVAEDFLIYDNGNFYNIISWPIHSVNFAPMTEHPFLSKFQTFGFWQINFEEYVKLVS